MLKKNLHVCFSRIHCLPSSFSHTPNNLEEEEGDDEDEATKLFETKTTNDIDGDTFSSSTSTTTEPDLSKLYASRRFFVSSPGTSNSILEGGWQSSVVPGGGIAVHKCSPDPYADFRKSMDEMVRARIRETRPGNENELHEYLRELLVCYLSLNPKDTHKFIVAAFTDLVLSLVSSELS